MKNADIIKGVTDYILAVTQSRNLTHHGIVAECEKHGIKIAQTTVSKMFSKPSSTTMSTLLKVCDGLELNLTAIFHSIENMKTAGDNNENRFRFSVDDDAIKRYLGEYHVFFLSTDPSSKTRLVHGSLTIGDLYQNGDCTAALKIATGDINENGEPKYKVFEGRITYSATGILFAELSTAKYGDKWLMTFPHVKLNIKSLACTMGCATTSCSGTIAYPAIHRFCICNKSVYPEISPETKKSIMGILRMQNNTLFIKKDVLKKYLDDTKDQNRIVTHIDHYLELANTYYAIPKSTFREDADQSTFYLVMAKLADLSGMESCMQIMPDDSNQLKDILDRNCAAAAVNEADG